MLWFVVGLIVGGVAGFVVAALKFWTDEGGE